MSDIDMNDVANSIDDISQKQEDIEIINPEDVEETYELDYDAVPSDDDEEYEEEVENADEDEEEQMMEDVPNDADITFMAHENPVYAVALHPTDGNVVISGGGDDIAYIWNRQTGEVLHKLTGHTDSVVAVAFSHDGLFVATGGYDGVVMIWSVASGELQRKLEGPSEEIEWICWHQKGYVILAGSGDGTAWMWLASTGDCMHVFAGHEEGVTCGSFTGSGKLAVTGSSDCTVKLWNPRAGSCVHTFKGHDFHEAPICTVVCHPMNPLMISGSQDGTARLIQIQTKKVLAVLDHRLDDHDHSKYSVECAGFASTQNWCATAGLDGTMRIWDLGNFQCRHVCRHDEGVIKLQWHPTKPIIFTASVDRKVRVWDARSGECLQCLQGHHDMILDMTLMIEKEQENTCIIATASDDGTCRIFKVNY